MARFNDRIVIHALVWLMLCFTIAAQSSAADGQAGDAGEFLRYGVDVRSLGMGQAYVALADDASALFYNPAGLLRMQRVYSFYAMNFRPFYESRFNFASFAISRPKQRAFGIASFLFGPGSAWGFAFIHHGSDGYEERTSDDVLIGDDFELYQQAFMLGFAREEVGTAGILDYGITFKIVNAGVSGALRDYGESGASVGFDVGVQFQMMNPPLLKDLTTAPLIGPFFKLEHLMPLRLGVSIRNVRSPRLGYGGGSEEFPTSLRIGASYTLSSNRLARRSRFVLASDFEWMYEDMNRLVRFDRRRRVEVHSLAPGSGQYFGVEFQYRKHNLQLCPRMGLSHVYDATRLSAGVGLSMNVAGVDLQFDFAHGYHGVLPDDQRVSLTIRFGGTRDGGFHSEGGRSLTSLRPLDDLLHTINDYPDNLGLVKSARDTLAGSVDTPNRMRYLELFVDLSLCGYLLDSARQELEGNHQTEANRLASLGRNAYGEAREDPTIPFDDKAWLDYAECVAIAAVTESDEGEAEDRWRRVGELAVRAAADSLRSLYLRGVAAQMTDRPDSATTLFDAALKTTGEDPRSLRVLSRFQMAQCLLQQGQADSSLEVLRPFYEDPNSLADSLAEHYPRLPAYDDHRLSDDALYLAASIHLARGREGARQALLMLGNICRYYPTLEKCRRGETEARIDELIEELSE